MITPDVLLYPDTGPEFLRALKMAILYARRVHVLTLLDKDLIDSYSADLGAQSAGNSGEQWALGSLNLGQRVPILGGGVPVPSTRKVSEYLSFVRQNQQDFALLVGEGVLTSDFPTAFGFGGTFHADANLRRVCERWPPSYWDFLQNLPLDPAQRLASFQGHLCFIASLAQQMGAGLATWSWDFQAALWASVAQLAEGGPISSEQSEHPITDVEKRGHLEVALAHQVLERYVPRVDDLPFAAILDLRRKCTPELDRFRDGLREVAAEVDVTQPPQGIDLQLRNAVSRRVDPAVHDLEAAIISTRFDLVKNLATKESLTAVMALGIAVATGQPFNIPAALAAAGATAVPQFVGMAVERQKALATSHWAILFRLKKLQRKLDPQFERHGHPPSITPN